MSSGPDRDSGYPDSELLLSNCLFVRFFRCWVRIRKSTVGTQRVSPISGPNLRARSRLGSRGGGGVGQRL